MADDGLAAMLRWGEKLRAKLGHPWFSCRYWCQAYEEHGLYCMKACYELDGFDLAGKPL